MSGRAVERIETTIDMVAATLFAAAMAFAAGNLLLGALPYPQWEAIAAAVLIIGFAGCLGVLRKIPVASQHLALPIFAPSPIETIQLDELVLTDADRFHPASVPSAQPDDPLVLDDILAELEPESRVVRLFDPAAMPTPGQLQARIDRHLDDGTSPTAPPDASQALFEALADLRRSLG
jgi:hypothetical protein